MFHARLPKVALNTLARNSRIALMHLKGVNAAQTHLASGHLPLLGQVPHGGAPGRIHENIGPLGAPPLAVRN